MLARRAPQISLDGATARRIGPARTLEVAPDEANAAQSVEAWLRDRQLASAGTVLVRTRGLPPERVDAIRRRVSRLQRQGVVKEFRATDADVIVDLAGVGRLLDAAPRTRRSGRQPKPTPARVIGALDEETRRALESLAVDTLRNLGLAIRPELVQAEMQRHHAVLSASVGAHETDRARRLLFIIDAARRDVQP